MLRSCLVCRYLSLRDGLLFLLFILDLLLDEVGPPLRLPRLCIVLGDLDEAPVLRAVLRLHQEHASVSLLHELHGHVRIVDGHPADEVPTLVNAFNFDLDLDNRTNKLDEVLMWRTRTTLKIDVSGVGVF